MDTTPKYIEMCEKAEEIQIYGKNNFKRLRPLFVFDLVLDRVSLVFWMPRKMRERLNCKGDEFIVSIEQNKDKGVYFEEGKMGGMIWLPRQDQLQEMIYSEYRKYCCTPYRMMIVHFEQFTDDVGLACYYDSMEQFWLAFVMKDKYNKIWDGKDWIKK